eukprot:5087316-Prymnesium_polylepis.1
MPKHCERLLLTAIERAARTTAPLVQRELLRMEGLTVCAGAPIARRSARAPRRSLEPVVESHHCVMGR